MHMLNATMQQIVNLKGITTTDIQRLSPETVADLVSLATEHLEALHTVESIENINNLAGAVGLIERSCLNILRACGAPTPKYSANPVVTNANILAFLASGNRAPNTPTPAATRPVRTRPAATLPAATTDGLGF